MKPEEEEKLRKIAEALLIQMETKPMANKLTDKQCDMVENILEDAQLGLEIFEKESGTTIKNYFYPISKKERSLIFSWIQEYDMENDFCFRTLNLRPNISQFIADEVCINYVNYEEID